MRRFILFYISLLLPCLIFIWSSDAKLDYKTAAGIWLFDEKDGVDVKDFSKNGNHGKLQGGAKRVAGKFGKAISLNGSTDRAVIPDADSLDLPSAWTITAWVYPNKTETNYGHILGKRNDALVNDANYAFRINNVGVAWEAYFRRDNTWFGAWGLGTVKKDQWSYMTAVYDGKNIITIYENAVQIGTGVVGGPPPLGQAEVHIGGWQNNTSELLDGILDEVALFNVALTVDDIQILMKDGIEKALGLTAVNKPGKITTEWGYIKLSR